MVTIPSIVVTVDGRTLADRDVRRGLRLVYVSTFVDVLFIVCCYGMPLPMLMERLNASGKLIGALSSLSLAAMSFQLAGSLLAERMPARKPVWFWSVFASRLMWFLPPLLLALGFGFWAVLPPVIVLVSAASTCVGNMSSAPWLSWVSDLIPAGMRGRFWGTRTAVINISNILAVGAYGWILDRYPDPRSTPGLTPTHAFLGFTLVFGFAAVSGVAAVVINWFTPEPRPNSATARQPIWQRLTEPFRQRNFLWFMLAVAAWSIACNLAGPFAVIYLKEQFHVSYSDLAATSIFACFGGIVGGLIGGYLADRIGARTFASVSMAIFCLFPFCWFFVSPATITLTLPGYGPLAIAQPILLLILVNVPAGMFGTFIGVCQSSLLSGLAPQEGRTLAIATQQTVVGLVAAVGPLTAGVVVDYLRAHPLGIMLPSGVPLSYMQVLVVFQVVLTLLVALPLHLVLRGPARELRVSEALSSMFTTNLWRAISSIVTLTGTAAPAARARAIRELGKSRTAIAVSDLITHLDDASLDVREEAALALGAIGSPDAVDALLAKFEDVDTDLAPEIARALRQSRDPRSVPALVRKLADADRETKVESARTLGAIGDRRAARSLLELLEASHDDTVFSASSEALARLGVIDAIYKIMPRMRATHNLVLKRSLAVAMGDLLGEPGEFYLLIVREQQAQGEMVERLLKDLRAAIREAAATRLVVEGQNLVGKADQLESAYMLKDYPRCTDLTLALALGLAALKHGIRYGGDAEVFVEDLVWHDERFAVGTWYLDLLRQAGGSEQLEVLLGIYFLSKWKFENR